MVPELGSVVHKWGNGAAGLSGSIFGSTTPQVVQPKLEDGDIVVNIGIGDRHIAMSTLRGKVGLMRSVLNGLSIVYL